MTAPGRKPRQIAVRIVGTPSDAALAGFARLLFAREQSRSAVRHAPKVGAGRTADSACRPG